MLSGHAEDMGRSPISQLCKIVRQLMPPDALGLAYG